MTYFAIFRTRVITNVVFAAALALGLITPALALAQSATATTSATASIACITPIRDLFVGRSDNASKDITALQQFLTAKGYFNVAATGYFGPITMRAVQAFQASQGVPSTGYFGPLSRAALVRIECGTTPPVSSVSIWSMAPTSGAVGTTVSLTGFGFTGDNTVLMDGLLAARNVPITSSIAIACTTDPSCHGGINQTLTFSIPSSIAPNCPADGVCAQFLREVTPGIYQVTVQNANGTSNALAFTVVDGTISTGAPSITGLDAPTTLTLGMSGTWTVHATLPAGATSGLQYSVAWGDEAVAGTSSIMAPAPTTTAATATFTHTYQRSGTYSPTFTVMNNVGASAKTSASVIVTPLY